MEKSVAVIIANPELGEEDGYIFPSDRIEIEVDGTLTIYTDDDSVITYLSGEWLGLEPCK